MAEGLVKKAETLKRTNTISYNENRESNYPKLTSGALESQMIKKVLVYIKPQDQNVLESFIGLYNYLHDKVHVHCDEWVIN